MEEKIFPREIGQTESLSGLGYKIAFTRLDEKLYKIKTSFEYVLSDSSITWNGVMRSYFTKYDNDLGKSFKDFLGTHSQEIRNAKYLERDNPEIPKEKIFFGELLVKTQLAFNLFRAFQKMNFEDKS